MALLALLARGAGLPTHPRTHPHHAHRTHAITPWPLAREEWQLASFCLCEGDITAMSATSACCSSRHLSLSLSFSLSPRSCFFLGSLFAGGHGRQRAAAGGATGRAHPTKFVAVVSGYVIPIRGVGALDARLSVFSCCSGACFYFSFSIVSVFFLSLFLSFFFHSPSSTFALVFFMPLAFWGIAPVCMAHRCSLFLCYFLAFHFFFFSSSSFVPPVFFFFDVFPTRLKFFSQDK